MVPSRPWLAQGDIFASAPLLHFDHVSATSEIGVAVEYGPALLLTPDCALDKRDRKTDRPRSEFVQLTRIRSIEAIDDDRRPMLRASKLEPYEFLYLGSLPEWGESFASLLDTYHLPYGYFAPELREFAESEGRPDDTGTYAVPTINDTRVGSVDPEVIDLHQFKLNAYWTRTLPEQ